MKREASTPRENWRQVVEEQGLTYAVDRAAGDRSYWDESAAYVLEESEADHLADVTEELHELSIKAAREMARRPELLRRHELPEWIAPELERSFEEEPFTLYGRFDLAYDGTAPAKMLEYNADTPAGLVEAASTQWHWLEELHPDKDQWNLIHERMLQGFTHLKAVSPVMHFAAGADEPLEDWNTLAYLREAAREVGIEDREVSMEDIGWNHSLHRFVDNDEAGIDLVFKMYPWEWMLSEEFGQRAAMVRSTRWIEPLWKTLLSSKGLLAMLWEQNPGHPNLLPTYYDNPGGMSEYVAKPLYGWEGAGIEVVTKSRKETGVVAHTAGQEKVFQAYTELPSFDGNLPVIGSWVVNGKPAGIGIRESDNLVTDTNARFVPHYLNAPRSSDELVASLLED
jgi:glutathionylspermidine synthase